MRLIGGMQPGAYWRPNRHDWKRHYKKGFTTTHCLFCKADLWITVPVEVREVPARYLHGHLEPGDEGLILRVTHIEDDLPPTIVGCCECDESYSVMIENWYVDPEATFGEQIEP